MHATLEQPQARRGPLDHKAKLLYGEMIAGSDANIEESEAQEVIYTLPHTPDIIRFWIDERSPDDPAIQRNDAREGRNDDCQHCSCVEVKLNKGEAAPTKPAYCDVYVAPSTRPTCVWIYRDPKTQAEKLPVKNGKFFQHKPEAGRRESYRKSLDIKVAQSKDRVLRHMGKLQVEEMTPWADLPASRKGIQTESTPAQAPKQTSNEKKKVDLEEKPLPPLPQSSSKKTVTIIVPKPEGFETDMLKDISRVVSRHDTFMLMRDEDDSDDSASDAASRDSLRSLHNERDATSRKSKRYSSLQVTGPRARNSGFWDGAAINAPGDVSIVEATDVELCQDFARPSLIKRIAAKIIMRLSRADVRKRR